MKYFLLILLFVCSCSGTARNGDQFEETGLQLDDKWDEVLSLAGSNLHADKQRLQEFSQGQGTSAMLASVILRHWVEEDNTYYLDQPQFVYNTLDPALGKLPPGSYEVDIFVDERGLPLSISVDDTKSESVRNMILKACKRSLFCPAKNKAGYQKATLRYRTILDSE